MLFCKIKKRKKKVFVVPNSVFSFSSLFPLSVKVKKNLMKLSVCRQSIDNAAFRLRCSWLNNSNGIIVFITGFQSLVKLIVRWYGNWGCDPFSAVWCLVISLLYKFIELNDNSGHVIATSTITGSVWCQTIGEQLYNGKGKLDVCLASPTADDKAYLFAYVG